MRFSLTERRKNMKSKPKFPKEYYDIEKVEGVTDETVRAYRSLIRHEMYEEKKRKQNEAFTYGHVDDIEYLLSTDNTTMTQNGIQNPRLAQAMDELRIRNENWYEAVMDYYIRCENASYGLLARKYNVSKVEVFRRVTLGVEFLIEKMAK